MIRDDFKCLKNNVTMELENLKRFTSKDYVKKLKVTRP